MQTILSSPIATPLLQPLRVAVIGAGVAGAACAASLARAGHGVTVFDKSRGVGGRMATRRASFAGVGGRPQLTQFDHGCRHFTASRPRFAAVVEGAVARGHAARWQQHLYATFPAPRLREVIVATPSMSAFCRHLLSGVPQRLGRAVTGLRRRLEGWFLQLQDDGAEEAAIDGPYDQVVLAIPAAQAAVLLADQQPTWAAALAEAPMQPCWTLMAVTDELDWPWDAADIDHGELAWIGRDDRKPGRTAAATSGYAVWVAHATPAWSRDHLEDAPAAVVEALSAALLKLLPGGQPTSWHHASVHRWRYAQIASAEAPWQKLSDRLDCWWDADLGLGVCGDAFGDGTVEAAWCSGDELADALAASFDAPLAVAGSAMA